MSERSDLKIYKEKCNKKWDCSQAQQSKLTANAK